MYSPVFSKLFKINLLYFKKFIGWEELIFYPTCFCYNDMLLKLY